MTAPDIQSADNPRFRRWVSIAGDVRQIRRHNQFLVSGRKIIADFLSASSQVRSVRPEAVLVGPEIAAEDVMARKIVDAAHSSALAVVSLASPLFRQLDEDHTDAPLLVCSFDDMPHWNPDAPAASFELFCPLSDPGNVGALVRSAAAFAVSTVVLLSEGALPYHPKAVRASAGAVLYQKFLKGPALTALVPMADAPFAGLDARGTPLHRVPWAKIRRLVVGEEGQGLPPGLCSTSIAVPMSGTVESLNATVAASIALAFRYVQIYSE